LHNFSNGIFDIAGIFIFYMFTGGHGGLGTMVDNMAAGYITAAFGATLFLTVVHSRIIIISFPVAI
jgi:hypothetical protein